MGQFSGEEEVGGGSPVFFKTWGDWTAAADAQPPAPLSNPPNTDVSHVSPRCCCLLPAQKGAGKGGGGGERHNNWSTSCKLHPFFFLIQ